MFVLFYFCGAALHIPDVLYNMYKLYQT